MQYLCLIYANEKDEPQPGTPEGDKHIGEYFAFNEEIQKKGQMVGGNALHPVSSATTVRVRNGKVETTDGPFAETKEQLGGYYLIDCNNLDEAIAAAAKIPSGRFGSIEVRPVMVFDDQD